MRAKYATDPERRAEIVRLVRRSALILIPAIGLFLFAGLLAWTVRRQLDTLTDGLVVDEPTDEVGAELTPA